jgi:hypothetical protein
MDLDLKWNFYVLSFSLTIVIHTSEAAASAHICSESIPFGKLRGGSDTQSYTGTTKSSESGSEYSLIHDPPGYKAPDMQDLLLLDVTHNTLCSSIANLLDVSTWVQRKC